MAKRKRAMFDLEKVPLPEPGTHSRYRRNQYPWARMEVGHSFVLADEARWDSAKRASRAYALRHPGVAFDWAVEERKGSPVLRIFRVR